MTLNHEAQIRTVLAQLSLQLYVPPPPRIAWVPRCDECGPLDLRRPYLVGAVLTYVLGRGWLCDACVPPDNAQAPPGREISG
jgi:hypothetical protein